MKKGIRLMFLGLILFFFSVSPVFASSESIQNFYTEIIAHKDGSLSVVENIKYDFSTNEKHGIFRTIPLTNLIENVKRKIDIQIVGVLRNGNEERFDVSKENSVLNLKIGKAEQTISGVQDYTISYKATNTIGNYDDHDEIYWNVTGTEWGVPINNAIASIKPDFDTSITKVTCFTGILDSKDKNCSFDKKNNTQFFQATKALNAKEGLTIVAAFNPNTFPKSEIEIVSPGISSASFYIFLIIILVLSFSYYIVLPFFVLRWYLKRRHKSRFKKPFVNFDIPKDNNKNRLLPAEAGVMDTAKLDRDDVIATIFDLAIRKYLIIEQTEKKKNFLGLGKGKEFVLRKKKDGQDLTTFEKTLFTRLFKNGDFVNLNSLSKDFYTTFNTLQTNIFSNIGEKRIL